MDGYFLRYFTQILTAIISLGKAQPNLQKHDLYEVRHHTQMVPNEGTTLIEIPCRWSVEGITSCTNLNGCYAINHLGNGHCQLVTNFLTTTLVEAAAPTSFICKYFIRNMRDVV